MPGTKMDLFQAPQKDVNGSFQPPPEDPLLHFCSLRGDSGAPEIIEKQVRFTFLQDAVFVFCTFYRRNVLKTRGFSLVLRKNSVFPRYYALFSVLQRCKQSEHTQKAQMRTDKKRGFMKISLSFLKVVEKVYV